MQRRWDDDGQLWEDLKEALADLGPMAGSVAREGAAVFSWRSVDEDLLLASLTFDSLLDGAGKRRSSSHGERVLVFQASAFSIELEVASDRILGQIDPPGVVEVMLQTTGGVTQTITSDDLGFFMAARPEGLVRLRCATPSALLVTDWVRL